MSYGAPLFLWLLAALPLLVALFLANERKRKALITRLVAARLQANLAGSVSNAKRRTRFVLILAGLGALILSLSQPRYGYVWEETKRKGHDVVIAIDTSKSMLSTDIAPDRLTRAKLAAQDLINLLPGDRVGLVAFAGSAFLQAPLTVDYGAVQSAINELDTKIIPRGGTDITEAIKLATDAFGKGESENRCLVLFTDGEDLDPNTMEAAKRAAPSFKIFTVGVGSSEGSLIPVPGESGGTSFVKDPQGQIVKSRLDEARLRQIADLTGGFYLHLGSEPQAMKRIVTDGLASIKEKEIDAKQARKPIERYQWPLAVGLFLLAAGFLINERVGSKAASKPRIASRALILLALLLPSAGFAKPDGLESYKLGKFDDAFTFYKDQLDQVPSSPIRNYNFGTAAYQKKDYTAALKAFGKALVTKEKDLKTKAEYNFANTLFQQAGAKQETKDKISDLKNAIQHYDSALLENPKHEEAKANKEAAERWIKELEKQQQEQKDQKDKEKKDDKQDDKKDQNQKDQDKKGDDKKDQDQKDQDKKGDDKKDQDQKDQDKKGNDKKDQDQKDPKDQKQGQSGKPDGADKPQNQSKDPNKPGPKPEPTPAGEKPSGEIQAQPSDEKKEKEAQQAQEAGEKPGEMSQQQAEALLQALANDEARVILNERKQAAPVLKDW